MLKNGWKCLRYVKKEMTLLECDNIFKCSFGSQILMQNHLAKDSFL